MVKYVLVTNAAKWPFIKYLESKNDHNLEKQTAKFCVGHDHNSVKNYYNEKENTVGGNTLGGKVYIFPLSSLFYQISISMSYDLNKEKTYFNKILTQTIKHYNNGIDVYSGKL